MAELDPAVKAIIEKTKPGLDEHTKRVKRYDRAYEVYRPPADRERKGWQSNLRVPYGMQVIDTALVNIVSGQPRVIVRPRRPQDEIGSTAMQLILDYYVGEDHLVEKQPTFVQQGLIYGVTVAKNTWDYEERNGNVIRDGPTFTPWNVYFAYWDPDATSADDAGYVTLMSYVSKDDLLKKQFNPDTGEGIYHNVDALLKTGDAQKPYSSAQQRFYGADARMREKFLLEETWTKDGLVVVGNGQVMMRQQDNPYSHGQKPVVIAQPRPDLFELQGIPETELVDDIQQALQTLQNMTIDNTHLTVMRGITYRESGVIDPNALELKPRFKWPVQDHDDIRPFEVHPISSDVFTERQRLMSDLQLVSGINPYVSGADSSGVDQNTATGITALQEVASRLLRFKASQIHYKGYQRSFEMWGDMAQQFMDKDIAVKIVGPGNASQWLNVSPHDIAGHYNYVLEGSEESLSRQQERGEAIALLNAFAPLIPTGQINIKPLLEKVASAYGFDNPEALLAAPQQQAPAAPFQQPQTPQPGQLVGGQSLSPLIQNAISRGR